MPRELIALEPRKPVLREYEEPELRLRQIRIRTEFASPKHGTEMVGYRNEPSARKAYDPEWGCMVPNPADEGPRNFPLGNMAVGVVTEVGPEVTRFGVGDRVFGHLPIRETHTVDEGAVDPLPDGLEAEAVVCLDPAVMALAMRDASIRLGDQVAGASQAQPGRKASLLMVGACSAATGKYRRSSGSAAWTLQSRHRGVFRRCSMPSAPRGSGVRSA
jgi:NADPH:quinone reductase-like Zn-dependent oxidoreductase